MRVSLKAQSSLRSAYVLVGGVLPGAAARVEDVELAGGPPEHLRPSHTSIPAATTDNPAPPRQQHDSLARGINHFRGVLG
jgi:hypothetical protein